MTDYSVAQTVLENDRRRVVHQLEDLGANENGDLRRDLDFGEGFADAASITAERTEVLGIVESLKTHLDDIDGALDRIISNDYGVCTNCGSRISPERMEARPISRLCVDCKSNVH